jgi:hypothetical protein
MSSPANIHNESTIRHELSCKHTKRKYNKTWALLQATRGKTNRTSFSCGVLSNVFTFWVPCRDVRCDFRIKTMFGSSPVVCRRSHFLYTLFCVCLRIVVSNTYCVVFFLFLSFFLRLVSCVLNIVSFSGSSIRSTWKFENRRKNLLFL